MKNITAIARLLKHGDRHFTIIHETNAMINLVAEYIEQINQAARETPLDIVQRSHLFEQFAYVKKARLDPFCLLTTVPSC